MTYDAGEEYDHDYTYSFFRTLFGKKLSHKEINTLIYCEDGGLTDMDSWGILRRRREQYPWTRDRRS